ncbi:MAG: DivIVA domain-containing protein [Oscillospiraceae bacterium]|nr:DivIVA domain-containing protein [Oscillospiraceae bacterium]MDY3792828.1 DivIVA domain-containing protein [Oscillospiraceae bacterium]MDY6208912.1 DivIVA domain-containing protein [Oscillospiraceae bacterium]
MITAMEINTKRFEQAKPGYKPEEVDEFLNQLADQISGMTKEKEDTEKKIEVLVESIRRYKADEEALKDAMIGAQKQARAVMEEAKSKADAIISEAQQKAEQIISAANVKADEIIGSTAVRAQREQETLEKMQAAVSDFKSNLLSMYKSHLELITSLPESDAEEKEETSEEDSVTASAPAPEDMEATRVINTASMQ